MIYRQFRAFTLIELMIVIAIIAILAGIMIPNYMQARAEAKMSSCKQNLLTIAKAIEMKNIHNTNSYEGSDVVDRRARFTCDDSCELVEQGFLAKAPRCPSTGDFYVFWYGQGYFCIFHEKRAHGDLGGELGPVYCNLSGIRDKEDYEQRCASYDNPAYNV